MLEALSFTAYRIIQSCIYGLFLEAEIIVLIIIFKSKNNLNVRKKYLIKKKQSKKIKTTIYNLPKNLIKYTDMFFNIHNSI